MLVFAERGKPEVPEKNFSGQSREPANSAHIMTPSPGIEPGTHWWAESALNPAPHNSRIYIDGSAHAQAMAWV